MTKQNKHPPPKKTHRSKRVANKSIGKRRVSNEHTLTLRGNGKGEKQWSRAVQSGKAGRREKKTRERQTRKGPCKSKTKTSTVSDVLCCAL